ncbi:MAG: hypothetical protein ABTQ29_01040 [Siculibacillus sp.]
MSEKFLHEGDERRKDVAPVPLPSPEGVRETASSDTAHGSGVTCPCRCGEHMAADEPPALTKVDSGREIGSNPRR